MILQFNDAGHLRLMAGLTQAKAAKYCGVSLRSITRYENGAIPRWYWHLMKYKAGGLPGWNGFRFEEGKIWTPANELVTASEVEHVRWMMQIVGQHQRRVLHEEVSRDFDKQMRLV